MIAPATISNCGALLAIMPGIALARKPRISASNEIRNGVAMPPPRRSTSIESCSSPAMPTVAAMICAASTASCRHSSSTAITAISAMLNNSGENAVSAKRPCAFNSAIMHGHRPGKGEIGQHQAGVVDGELQRLAARQIPAPAR